MEVCVACYDVGATKENIALCKPQVHRADSMCLFGPKPAMWLVYI